MAVAGSARGIVVSSERPSLNEEQIEEAVARGLAGFPVDGKRVLTLLPDATRTMPVPLFFRLLTRHLLPRVASLDFMIALGTHPPLDQAHLLSHVGLTRAEKAGTYAAVGVRNHDWTETDALVELGILPGNEIAAISGGLWERDVPVRLNRSVLEYDHLLVCGPVFPHEVVGFSGGNKYFFPGIAGQEIIDFTHWLGGLLTTRAIIGIKDTPIRRLIDRAAAMIPRPRHALCAVVTHDGVAGVYCGTPEEAFSAAADRSAQEHIVFVERPFHKVLAVLPAMYDELWVGAKGMYKTEPVVVDGGEVILYAPHLREISRTHGAKIRTVGYHVRDYFLSQWDRFKDTPGGVLGHCMRLRGGGTYHDGVERPRIEVTLATGIPEAECRAVNLGYRDPRTIEPLSFAGREQQGVLYVPRAGEIVFQLGTPRTGGRAKQPEDW
ncbi:MAG TPA: lactate racemase domain-containing protein [Polyangiaceae bacterium]|jgi:nickel-dependent lactate racemase|nr:lactate racemase domain-containing protein [Polyangiaceae bacterium]